MQHDRSVPSDRYENVSPGCLPNCTPTEAELIVLNSSMVKGKSFGEGRICTHGHKSFSRQLAKWALPLIIKMYVRVQPPLQWKGGQLTELFKNKGSPSSCSNYRDILLADDEGKAVCRLIRKRFLRVAVALSKDTQFGGGFHGGETAFVQLYMRLVID